MAISPQPSGDDAALADLDAPRSHREVVGHLQALLRMRTVNPPGDEIVAARHLDAVLREAGLRPTVLEPFPGRGSIVARLRGEDPGAPALLLMGHLDVVPVEAARWTHDPFGGEIDDGRLYGRGAVDMKSMVAMELQVVLELARAARAAGRDPSRDPVPGLRRDVIFAATADEEAGGRHGMGWIVDHEPELIRAAALNEAGGVSLELLGRRFYPIQVAEKGYEWYRIVVRGTSGHASIPREDNAAVLAARVVDRLAAPGSPHVTAVMRSAVEAIADALPASAGERLRDVLGPDRAAADAAIDALCDEPYRATLRALLRDTVSPDVVLAGAKTNVIPGEAEILVDCRVLPGTSGQAMTAELRRRIGEDLIGRCEIATTLSGAPVEQPLDHPLYGLLGEVLRRHDTDAIPVPIMAPFATDAKHTTRLGIPTYGFSPLRLGPGDRYLELYHGDDERVSLAALRFGFPVLYEVVRRYCG